MRILIACEGITEAMATQWGGINRGWGHSRNTGI